MIKLSLRFEKSKANYGGVLGFLNCFFVMLGFWQGRLGNLRFKDIIKKIHTHTSIYDGLDAIQVVLESPYSNQNPTFTAVLGASHHHLFDSVIRAHKGGLVGLRWMFFFFLLSFLSHSLENHVWTFKKWIVLSGM
jgi:hypothetical protein